MAGGRAAWQGITGMNCSYWLLLINNCRSLLSESILSLSKIAALLRSVGDAGLTWAADTQTCNSATTQTDT